MTERSYLSIGDVLALLREEFPDITISKIRFLESRGLLVPERTPSGYRKFYDHDVNRLRWILRQQREHFLPLKVIKGRLEGADVSDAPALFDLAPGDPPPADTHATGASNVPVVAEVAPSLVREPALAGHRVNGTHEHDELPDRASVLAAAQGARASLGANNGAPSAGAAASPSAAVAPSAVAPPSAARQPAVATVVAASHGATGAPSAAEQRGTVRSELRTGSGGQPARGPVGGSVSGERPAGGSDAAGTAPAPAAPEGGAVRAPAAGAPAPPAVPGPAPASAAAPPAAPASAAGPAPAAAHAPPPASAAPSAAARGRDHPAATAQTPRPARPAVPEVPAGGSGGGETAPVLTGASLTAAELAHASGLDLAQVEQLESFGLILGRTVAGVRCYDEEALVVAGLAAGFAAFGVEARHLRLFKHAAERQIGLYSQVVLPLLRQRNPEARRRALDELSRLAELGASLQGCFARELLRDLTGG